MASVNPVPLMADGDELAALRASHTPSAIRGRLAQRPGHGFLHDFIYGAIDGVVTTFAVVASAAGAGLNSGIIIVLGVANLVADGFSMASGNYLGTRAQRERHEALRNEELRQIQLYPEGEVEEIRQIFIQKGFQGKQLEDAVSMITSNRERWVATMLTDELGLSTEPYNPLRAGWYTFASFIAIGAIPLTPYLVQTVSPSFCTRPFLVSSVMALIAFFLIGAVKAVAIGQRWYIAGLETFSVGALAATIAYSAGALLRHLFAVG